MCYRHFVGDSIVKIFFELARITKTGEELISFWPTRQNFPGMLIEKLGDYLAESAEKFSFIPPEISRFESANQVDRWLSRAGLKMLSSTMSIKDLYAQAVVVAEK